MPPPPPPPAPGDPTSFPRTADGKPDLTGVWTVGMTGLIMGRNEPLNAQYAAKRQHWNEMIAKGQPLADRPSLCQGFGMPRVMGMDPTEIIATPKQVTILSEELHEVRRVFLDGRPSPPKDYDPTFDGHSVGHWEGDTLVVETIGMVPFDDGIWLSGDKTHITERFSMVNKDAISDEITVHDPAVLTEDWKLTRFYRRTPPRTEITEYICTNNRNLPNAEGVQQAK